MIAQCLAGSSIVTQVSQSVSQFRKVGIELEQLQMGITVVRVDPYSGYLACHAGEI